MIIKLTNEKAAKASNELTDAFRQYIALYGTDDTRAYCRAFLSFASLDEKNK